MSIYERTAFLRRVELLKEDIASWEAYPFQIEAVRQLGELAFHPKVTFLIGENGSGKSTITEGIAVALGFNAEGGTINFSFHTEESHSELYRYLRPVRGPQRPRDGFFFRAESYYNLATNIDQMDREESFGPPISHSYGGKSLHQQSHGESFFSAFLHRFGGKGLYIMDEPEAALSPTRQLSMLGRIHELVNRQSQFIIATHSPILMGYPDAWIYEIGRHGIRRVEWEETEHYIVTRQFLGNRDKMLGELLGGQHE
jgi:predicted ATPase